MTIFMKNDGKSSIYSYEYYFLSRLQLLDKQLIFEGGSFCPFFKVLVLSNDQILSNIYSSSEIRNSYGLAPTFY
jgi:hypothetical protein